MARRIIKPRDNKSPGKNRGSAPKKSGGGGGGRNSVYNDSILPDAFFSTPEPYAPPRKPAAPRATGPQAGGSQNVGGGSWGGSPYGGGVSTFSGGGAPGGAVPEEPGMSREELDAKIDDYDWLRGQDSQFLAAEAGYQKALDQLLATNKRETSDYNQELDRALGNIGFDRGGDWDAAAGTFNWQDTDTAAGRSRENLLNDFAARGMLQGSGFADGFNSLQRSLTDQVGGMFDTRSQFLGQQSEENTQGRETFETNRRLAAQQALDRIAAEMGIV